MYEKRMIAGLPDANMGDCDRFPAHYAEHCVYELSGWRRRLNKFPLQTEKTHV